MPKMTSLLEQLRTTLNERILLLDGAMGTVIQNYKLDEQAYRGERFAKHSVDLKGNNDLLTLTQPSIIEAIHRSFLDAGADIVDLNCGCPAPLAHILRASRNCRIGKYRGILLKCWENLNLQVFVKGHKAW